MKEINPIIRGWCNYYKHVVSKETFNAMDYLLFRKIMRKVYRQFQHTSTKQAMKSSYTQKGNKKWAYGDLMEHIKTSIERHVKVRGDKSPYDDNPF